MREGRSGAPPRLACFLLDFVARSEEKRTVAGDMDEWFAEIARLEGRRRARRWYWGQVVAAHVDEQEARSKIPFLLPLREIHFATDFDFGMEATAARRQVALFFLIAVFILLLACINDMNLATARFVRRSREVGIRRVVGAGRKHLIRQFLVESFLVSGLAALISLAFLAVALPAFNRWTGRDFSFRPLAEPSVSTILSTAYIHQLATRTCSINYDSNPVAF